MNKLTKAALLGAALFFFLCAGRAPRYNVLATFKQTASKTEQQNLDMKSLLKSVVSLDGDGTALAVLQSKRLQRAVIERLGMQIESKEARFFEHLRRNLLTECGMPLKDPEAFVFEDVVYEGEKKLSFTLHFLTPDTFEMQGKRGKIGEKFDAGSFSFTLKKCPASSKSSSFTLSPWVKIAELTTQRLHIRPLKNDPNILRLTFYDSDRGRAAAFLNELMASYQRYLCEENEEMAKAQIAYLERRQEELTQKCNDALASYAHYLGKNGSLGLEEEMRMLAGPKERLTQKLLESDLLKKEKQLLENKLKEFGDHMASLPEKWMLENQLKLKQELSMSMLEGLAHLVESKNINAHLYQVASKPIDKAIPPFKPQYPFILLYTCLGALIGVVAQTGWSVLFLKDEKNPCHRWTWFSRLASLRSPS